MDINEHVDAWFARERSLAPVCAIAHAEAEAVHDGKIVARFRTVLAILSGR